MANSVARELRKRMTSQEVKLWVRLRKLRSQMNLHFRRQVPIGNFIVDFACLRKLIVIEVDGGQHATDTGHSADRLRDKTLVEKGFRVLRFWNSDVDENIDGVVETILSACHPTPPRKRGDPPL
ncbi:MAG: endonuclease domain-containing protein [Xanthobacteraceae bacterium]|nr:endonuclease domain-containing protein [Xanthobacteraceae bacterium]